MEKECEVLILKAQKNEITECEIYSKLSEKTKDKDNKKILKEIAIDELKHYNLLKKVSNKDIKSNWISVHLYVFLSSIFGLSFGLKLMCRMKHMNIEAFKKIKNNVPSATIMKNEHRHEKKLLDLLKEEKVEYAGSIVLGLNDALVELTGALSGLTFALQNGKIIAVTGLITGIAASLSMAASCYLSSREEEYKNNKSATKAALYTGLTYIITVSLLVSPYLIFNNVYVALAVMLGVAILVIGSYSFYITTVKDLRFSKRFLEMAGISLSVAFISFLIGLIIKNVFMLEI